jgi:hypothetical protein
MVSGISIATIFLVIYKFMAFIASDKLPFKKKQEFSGENEGLL